MEKPIKTTFKTIISIIHKSINICDRKSNRCIELLYTYDEKGNLQNAYLRETFDPLLFDFNSFQDVEKAEEDFKCKSRLYMQVLALLKEEFKEKKSNYSNLSFEESVITSPSIELYELPKNSDPVKENLIRTYNTSLSYKKIREDIPMEKVLKIIEKIIVETPGIINKIALMREIKSILTCDNYKKLKENFEIKTANWREINKNLVYKINTNQEIPFTIKIEKKQ